MPAARSRSGCRAARCPTRSWAGPDEVPAGDAPAVGPPGEQPGSGDAIVPVADRTTVPADDNGWTAVLAELYTRRAAAFATADPAPLGSVYPAGSALLDRDVGQLGAL